MTVAFTTPDAFTDATLPLYPLEAVPGTLVQVEPGRTPSLVGVPGNNGVIPNLASWLAGSGVIVTASNVVAGVCVTERSSKGGIHVIRTQANTFCQWGVSLNQVVRQYILDNIGHKFYFSVHGRITRNPTQALDAFFGLTFSTGANNSRLLVAMLADGTVYPASSAIKITKKYPETSLVSASPSPFYMGASVQGYTGPTDIDAASSQSKTPMFQVGANWPFNQSAAGGASKLLYRIFVEDQTVSGRSETELRDLDYAWFNDDVLTPGGYYYGDTWTSPSTVP